MLKLIIWILLILGLQMLIRIENVNAGIDVNSTVTSYSGFTTSFAKKGLNMTCKEPSVNEFPKDSFIPFDTSRYARLIIHSAIIIYLVIALTIVCDEFFVGSLIKISNDLNLRDDIAGATLMAIGCSAPELFTSLIGVTVAKSDIGTSAIVGSALFNVLFIIAICGLVVKKKTIIDFYPLCRDCFYYFIALLFLLFVMHGNSIFWFESIIMISLYFIYIVIMYFNKKLEIKIKRWINGENKNIVINMNDLFKNSTENEPMLTKDLSDDEDSVKNTIKITQLNSKEDKIDFDDKDEDENEEKLEVEDEQEIFYPFTLPADKVSFGFLKWIILLPIKTVFYFTIPNYKDGCFSKFPLYFLSFAASCAYIGIFTYTIIWMVVIIADKIKIPDTVAGLVLLSFFSSLPEVATSVIIARKDKASMSISNSIGSNIFDVLICLGLPWFIQSLIIKPFQPIEVYSGGIFYSVGLLLTSIAILISSFKLNKWKLDKKLGAFLLIIWTSFTVLMCLFEYNVFGNFTLPTCD